MDNFYFAGKVPEIDFGNMAAVFFEGQERGGKKVGKIFCGGIFSLMELIFLSAAEIFSKKILFGSSTVKPLFSENALGGGKYGGKTENRSQKKGLRN